jgi:alpha-glutamyl/putrescinyl thymine pyrophosphorylase clade 1
MFTRDDELLNYMIERERIRLHRKAGQPWPWTDDPILREYRFTNIRREDDAVTIWITKNWKQPHEDDPHLWFAMMVARLLNLPESMEALGYPVPWQPERWVTVLKERAANGLKNFNPAYQVCLTNTPGNKAELFAKHVLTPIWTRRKEITQRLRGASLASAAAVFGTCPHFAGFMAGQVIHDLKWTPLLRKAPDWWDWAAPGPGSGPGMNRLLGRPAGTAADWKGREGTWLRELHALRHRLDPQLEAAGLPDLCAQNWQHNLCEANKLWRAQAGEGMPKQKFKRVDVGLFAE